MIRELELVTEWLLCASGQIAQEYLLLPDASDEPKSRERVYCYELYHRWRCHWPRNFKFFLNGEVDKKRHPVIPGEPKPDFLVHVPGKMSEMSNLLVMEVKPGNADPTRMRDDLNKLTQFRRNLSHHDQPANYFAAYLWIYRLQFNEWPTLRSKLLSAQQSNEFDPSLISCFIHEEAGTRAVPVSWK